MVKPLTSDPQYRSKMAKFRRWRKKLSVAAFKRHNSVRQLKSEKGITMVHIYMNKSQLIRFIRGDEVRLNGSIATKLYIDDVD